MPTLKVTLLNDKRSYRPAEEISGEVEWELDHDVLEVCVSLVWFTSGKGTTDGEAVERIKFAHPAKRERRPFRFKLPESPYSFSGQLITLGWGIELEVEGEDLDVVREDFVMSPTEQEISLGTVKEANPQFIRPGQ